jgi:superfamily II DNA or RNA helicase
MNLIEQNFPDDITTGHQSPSLELFIPLLKSATKFDVAVGYFTSGWLKDVAEGMAEFAKRGGVARWVVSPVLNERDALCVVELDENYDALVSLHERSLIEVIKSLKEETRKELCSLIGAGVMEFKIAVPRTKTTGMLHAKMGIAEDESANKVAFTGSYNLTANAKNNWERIDIFKSWEPGEEKRVIKNKYLFDLLWKDEDPSFKTLTPSKDLITFITNESGPQIKEYFVASKKRNLALPVTLRNYQIEAIEKWGENNCKGTYVMATGSGKTITALATIHKLISIINKDNEKPLFIVIVLPLKHLLDQWYLEAMEFGFDSVKCYENSEVWRSALAEKIGALKVTRNGYVIAMVTNATFSGGPFQRVMAGIDFEFLIVADEAHNLGSEKYLKALPENSTRRLALSATPKRFNDVGGTKALFRFFGPAVIEFELSDAIKNGFLCEYEYYPHICLMSEEEYEEYLELSEYIRIEKSKSGDSGEKTKEHNRFLGKRNDLITGLGSKLQILTEQLSNQKNSEGVSHTLIYCGSRKGEDEIRHIERTVKEVGKLGIKTRKFTAEESLDDRREILGLFANGDLEAIAAIKCLDEGIDIPATRVAYILASTANPREFIQRRGRVLRRSPGKEKAVIHDFLVAPPYRRDENDDLVERELERASEFSALALNKEECLRKLKEFSNNFGV